MVRGDQCAEASAINQSDVGQIQENLFLALGEQGFDLFAERVRLFPKHDAPIERDNGNAVHFPVDHFQRHVCSPYLEILQQADWSGLQRY